MTTQTVARRFGFATSSQVGRFTAHANGVGVKVGDPCTLAHAVGVAVKRKT